MRELRAQSTANSFSGHGADASHVAAPIPGFQVLHPLTQESLPVFAADYVLAYGSGAVMGVPAHDERDWRFAQQHGLPVRVVIQRVDDDSPLEGPYTEPTGVLVNSGEFTGMSPAEATVRMVQSLESSGLFCAYVYICMYTCL